MGSFEIHAKNLVLGEVRLQFSYLLLMSVVDELLDGATLFIKGAWVQFLKMEFFNDVLLAKKHWFQISVQLVKLLGSMKRLCILPIRYLAV